MLGEETVKTCSIPECDRVVMARGWCSRHYQRWFRHGDPLLGNANVERPGASRTCGNCDGPHYGHGLCIACWTRMRRHGDLTPRYRRVAGTAEERLLAGIDVRGSEECWPWRGKTSRGYGRLVVDGQARQAHRLAYEHFVGPIPVGMDIDHVCHNDSGCVGGPCSHRRCCNPSHLEPATRAENVMRGESSAAKNSRKTYCIRGHAFTPENTLLTSLGRRECRSCRNEREKARGRSMVRP